MGFALQSWFPYLKYLRENTAHRIHLHGARGLEPFANFAQSYQVHSPRILGPGYGDVRGYIEVDRSLPHRLIFPSTGTNNRISVDGLAWTNPLTELPIHNTHYSKLDYGDFPIPSEIPRPYVVLSNKNYVTEGQFHNVNHLQNSEIQAIAKFLGQRGTTLVYNVFPVDPDSYDSPIENPVDFSELPNVIDMRDHYAETTDPDQRNRDQLGLYAHAHSAIAVQGGNAVIPIVCRCPTRILMRWGRDYSHYKSLEKIYGVPNACFYEVCLLYTSPSPRDRG